MTEILLFQLFSLKITVKNLKNIKYYRISIEILFGHNV